MTQLYGIKVKLSSNQKQNLAKAYHKREAITLRLGKDSLSGNDALNVPANVVKKRKKIFSYKKEWISNYLSQILGIKWGVLF